jgi:type I protein arginine methyltransferase
MAYSISLYGSMIADTVRTGAYARALERSVKPGSVVIDLGAGTGIMSLISCRLGARKVFAIESDEDAIEVARQIAKANGLEDQIEFVAGHSTAVTMSEPADVIVSDLRGVLPLHTTLVPSIVDARTRLLKKEGVLIPQSDTIRAALVEAEELYREHIGSWTEHGRGFDLKVAQELVANTFTNARFQVSDLLTDSQTVTTLDFRTIEEPSITSTLSFEISRGGTAHGLCLWFDATLIEGVGYSSAPGQPKTIYRQGFLPLRDPVVVAAGDSADILVAASLVGGDYVWRWDTTIRRGGEIQASYRQSTALAAPLTTRLLETNSEAYVPELNEEGEAVRFGLGLMDGQLSSGEIAARLAEHLPNGIPPDSDSLHFVIGLVRKYAR